MNWEIPERIEEFGSTQGGKGRRRKNIVHPRTLYLYRRLLGMARGEEVLPRPTTGAREQRRN